MNAKKCDRCKKYYDEYAGIHKRSEEGTIFHKGLHKWGMSPNGEPLFEIPFNQVILENRTKREHIDLCPECMQAFDNWLKEKGE